MASRRVRRPASTPSASATRRSTSCPTSASARSSPALSGWPTIPQLFVKGELVGGADIVTEMYETGELAELLEAEQPEEAEEAAAQSEAPVGNGPLPLENRLD